MKFTSTLLSTVLFATAILAAPKGQPQPRATRVQRSKPMIALSEASNHGEGGNISMVQYSSNWAGAVLTAPPAGQTFNSVSGQFTVPTPQPPVSGNGAWSGSAWVGIDGDTYQNAILQTGFDWTVTVSGSSKTYSYQAWYEWYPNPAYNFAGIPIAAGNVISMTVTSSSSSAGVVTIKNLSTGVTVSKSLTAPSGSSHLGGQNAEWIVEDYEQGGSLVPFANFGNTLFTNTVAKTPSQTLSNSGATIIEIENASGQVLTGVTLPNTSEVSIDYE